MIKYTGDPRRDFEKATAVIVKQKNKISEYQEKVHSLQIAVKKLETARESEKRAYEDALSQKDAQIKELKNQLAHAQAILNHDGTNTGLPTSMTKPGGTKVIPNSRRGSNNPKGGQIGHEKAVLNAVDDSETTDTVDHTMQDGDHCPKCSSEDCTPTGEVEEKYEYDVRVKVVRIKHKFYYYKCNRCGRVFRTQIPPHLKEKAQYGSQLQAFALSLTNTVNAPMNKVSMFLSGITGNALNPCDGYVAKLQAKAARLLVQFREDLKLLLITRQVVYWDDTVIMILTERACFRFYGDETIAYYTAHMHKDMDGLDRDNVLNLLTGETQVMHDHNTVNYNPKYSFANIECNQHLQRDCQKNSDDTCHKWSSDLKGLIATTIKERKDAVGRGEESFSEGYISQFNEKLDKCLADGRKENEAEPNNYGAGFERTLLNRIEKYRKNYFKWVEDFRLPTTNDLAERGLRSLKTRMKVSGQFESEEAADNHALIRTYTETCRRNGINEIDALQRLCNGTPYSVSEIFA